MENANISLEDIVAQYEQEQRQKVTSSSTVKKTKFDEKNYLQVRLKPGETSKTLTIRLLPFSPEGGTPFQKVHMHTVKVNKEVSPSGWKTFVCPVNNKKDGENMGEGCPFCETSKKARELKFSAQDEIMKKKYGDIEFINRVKDMWIVRCIERDHEEDGPKFWLFNASKENKGPYDQMYGLMKIRAEQAAKKGNKYNIFDLTNGLDLVVTVTRTSENKTAIQIYDSGFPSPLTDDEELKNKWVGDQKKWYDVYTVKPYDYMSIIVGGGVPVFNKELGKFVDKEESNRISEEAEKARIEDELTAEAKDYSEIATGGVIHNEIGGTSNDSSYDMLF